jgi:hypothetical protein
LQRVLTIIGLGAAAVLILASATMNYMFASSLGRGSFEGQVLGVVSVAVDILKALLAVFVAWAASEGRRTFVVIGGLAFLLFTTASMLAATGFASQNRGAVSNAGTVLNARLSVAERDLAGLNSKLQALPAHRPASLVEEAVNAAHHDRRWQPSKECTVQINSATRDFCDGYFRLRAELAAAREAARLDEVIGRQQALIDRMIAGGGGSLADPQARLLAQAFGIEEASVQRLLMTLIALVVEVSSGLGVYLATGHGRSANRKPDPEPLLTPTSVATPAAELLPAAPQVVINAQPAESDRLRRRGGLRAPAVGSNDRGRLLRTEE